MPCPSGPQDAARSEESALSLTGGRVPLLTAWPRGSAGAAHRPGARRLPRLPRRHPLLHRRRGPAPVETLPPPRRHPGRRLPPRLGTGGLPLPGAALPSRARRPRRRGPACRGRARGPGDGAGPRRRRPHPRARRLQRRPRRPRARALAARLAPLLGPGACPGTVLRASDRKSLAWTIEQGVKQTLGYMKRCGAEEVHLVVIDRQACAEERGRSDGVEDRRSGEGGAVVWTL